jgi:hypothetical protein
MRRYINNSILTISALAMTVSFSLPIGQLVFAQDNLQPTPNSNNTIDSSMTKNSSSTFGGSLPNNHSAWLLICKAPPITDIEEQCDPPTRLH